MSKNNLTRRHFLSNASTGTLAVFASGGIPSFSIINKEASTLAILGGQPVRAKSFPTWPIVDETDENLVMSALRSGRWSRGELVAKVEKRFVEFMGAKCGLLTGSGTQALHTSIHTLGIGGGDEVITTPFTFIATIDAILLEDALPVFADVDPETFMINPDKIEEKITENTRAILPVHITGGVAHMDKINAIAKKHNLKVIEDACQAILAEWNHKKVSTLGDLGCFSFANSKCLTCGEGGAILGDDQEIMDRCYAFHTFGRAQGKFMPRDKYTYPILGLKYRTMSLNSALLDAQMNRVEEQCKKRSENADYLTSKIKEIPGIIPRKDYPETTRTSYYTYGFRYKKEHFNNLPRAKFLSALRAEGIPCGFELGTIGSNSAPMNKEGAIVDAINSKSFKKIYSKERLNKYIEGNNCPDSDQMCQEIAGFNQNLLLGTKEDMNDVANAILKVYENRDKLS